VGSKCANLIRTALPEISVSVTGSQAFTLARTLDARLAIGSMIVQTIGLWNSLESAKKRILPPVCVMRITAHSIAL
jgi:hypothetical protein